MAKVSPYGDPSAHGKLTPGLCFKRRGRIVQLGKCPRPKDKRSAAQIEQRNKIKTAVAKYKILNYDELIFLRRRGSMISKNPYMLYTSSQLVGNDWNKDHGHQLQIIDDIVIFDLIQDQLEEIRFTLISSNTKDITDNIVLYSKLDSETAGVITSVEGTDLIWSGTPLHEELKFDDGAFNQVGGNRLLADDNGQSFMESIEDHMLSTWIKTEYDVINGKPQDGNVHVILDWRGQNTDGGLNLFQVGLHNSRGLYVVLWVDGSKQELFTINTNITFSAGDIVYIAYAYNREGIGDDLDNIEIYFGTEDEIFLVGTKKTTLDKFDTNTSLLSFLASAPATAPLKGGFDNIKIIKNITRNIINEMNATRKIEEFEIELGYIFDNENIFYPGDAVEVVPELILKIESFSALPWNLPFYWLLAVTWSNQTNDQRTTNIRFPKYEIESSQAVRFFLSTDMSLYFDQNLIKLGATSNV